MVEALAGFNDEWQYFRVEPVGPGVVREAEFMIQSYGKTLSLRTLDAIHLATFNLIAERDWHFVAADKTLVKVARAIGFSVINPLEKA
jgi:hypothetical protein